MKLPKKEESEALLGLLQIYDSEISNGYQRSANTRSERHRNEAGKIKTSYVDLCTRWHLDPSYVEDGAKFEKYALHWGITTQKLTGKQAKQIQTYDMPPQALFLYLVPFETSGQINYFGWDRQFEESTELSPEAREAARERNRHHSAEELKASLQPKEKKSRKKEECSIILESNRYSLPKDRKYRLPPYSRHLPGAPSV